MSGTHEFVTPSEKVQVVDAMISSQKRGARFWLVFLVLGVVSLLSAFEASAISTALPRIVTELHGEAVYIWFITGYLITASIFMPIFGQLADIFGRRSSLIAAILCFMLGSGLSGGATNSAMLIGARIIQGIGGAGQLTLTDIIISDIVALRERGKFVGIIGSVWALGTVIGPVIGGALANAGQWRWIFYLNLPIGGVALVFCVLFLRVKEPEGSILVKLRAVDFVGSLVFLGSLVSIQIALARGGVVYEWQAWQILVPLLAGFFGLSLFVVWIWNSKKFGINPLIPTSLFGSRTASVGFLLTFLHGLLAFGFIYIMPIYFEGVRGSSSLRTGVQVFPFTFVTAPFAIVAGAIIAMTGRYKNLNISAFIIMTLGCGLFQLLVTRSPDWHWIVFEIVFAIGAGLMFTASLPAVQAAVEPSEMAASTALYGFMRNFGAVWGLALSTSIFNFKINALAKSVVPDEVYALLRDGGAFGIASLGYDVFGPFADQVKDLAVAALHYCFWMMFAVSAFGIIAALFYEDLHLSTELDSEYGLKHTSAEDAEAHQVDK